MCGIAGFFAPRSGAWESAARTVIRQMTDCLHHRGPDDYGDWVDAAGIALGFRRLAIIDLSPDGHQPMVSAQGRYVIIFNGEIYNFAALRRELEQYGHRFRGHSDTEIMLAAFEQWGVHAAVTRFIGMFAFALWDRHDAALHLVRDRLGKKPLYYGRMGTTLVFGSELKALRAHPDFRAQVNRDALALYMRYGYVPAPYSIYQDVYKLPPGTILTIREPSASPPAPVAYWSAREVAERGVADPYRATAVSATADLDTLLRDAVALRMVADVPLGAFLSGGIDSSTVVGLMQAQSSRPVRTFSIGFPDPQYDEAPHAKAIAKHLGTEHTELYVTAREALDTVPQLPTLYDEPFADASQIPTFLISTLTRRYVTVALSGDGGDELFGGYARYARNKQIWERTRRLPRLVRVSSAQTLAAIPAGGWKWVLQLAAPLRSGNDSCHGMTARMGKLAQILQARDLEVAYAALESCWGGWNSPVRGARNPPDPWLDSSRWATIPDITQRMMYLDIMMYLPDDILVKVDRASMGASLEVRAPLLDHRVVEFAWRLPLSMHIHGTQRKWLLRQVLYRYIPRALIERPKKGFSVPLAAWLRGPLREWAASLLDERRMRDEGFLDPRPIRQQWHEHLSGSRDWHHSLWPVLMFEAWLTAQAEPVAAVPAVPV